MRIFLTNWKGALRRERIWLILVILHGLTAFMAAVEDIGLLDSVTLSIVLWIGPCLAIALSRGQFAIAAKPFSYCLPGYRESFAKLHFSASLLFSGSFVLVEILRAHGHWPSRFPDVGWRSMVCKTLSMILMGMVTFLAIETTRLLLFRLPRTLSVLGSVVVFYVGLVVFHSVRTDRVVVERLFVSQMARSAPLGTARCLWGALYLTFGPALLFWKWMLLAVLAFILVCSRGGPEAVAVIFIALGIMAWFVPLRFRSSLLFPTGRRERYITTAFVAVVTSTAFVMLAGAIAGLSLFVAPLWPDSSPFSAADIRWSGALLPSLVLPWSFALQLLGFQTPGLLAVLVGRLYLLDVVSRLSARIDWLARAHSPLLAVVCISAWPLFLLVLRRICMKCSLVPTRTRTGGPL